MCWLRKSTAVWVGKGLHAGSWRVGVAPQIPPAHPPTHHTHSTSKHLHGLGRRGDDGAGALAEVGRAPELRCVLIRHVTTTRHDLHRRWVRAGG